MENDSLNPQHWLEYAKADLDSAKILINKTENYHIVTYHCHQAVEKIFKRFLLLNKKKFPFIHELVELLTIICKIQDHKNLLDDVSYLMDLYTNTKYPHGDTITKQEAIKALSIAENILNTMTEI